MTYFRPLPQSGAPRPTTALPLAGGPLWFTHVECRERGAPGRVVPASELPADWAEALTAPRAPVAGVAMERPNIMGILNVTPDSFSDGGRFTAPEAARAHAKAMIAAGADILDIGGESTRPGAAEVPVDEEIARTAPVIAAIAQSGLPISIDTRKAEVAHAALDAGAVLVNDVSAMLFDPQMTALVADQAAPVCLMHAQGRPEDMQDDPRYDDALLDVYDHLAERIAHAEAAGIARDQIVVDPGIGFGKALAHNRALLEGLSLLHGLGCPILLGASRKSVIDQMKPGTPVEERLPGSLALALAGAAQGAQILRMHDVAETRQALTVWQAATGSAPNNKEHEHG